MRETGRNGFKVKLKKKIQKEFPNCMIFPLDPNDTQGVPDLLVLEKDKWATLETKGYAKAHKQPNQEYYVDLMDNMGFSKFVSPENEKEVMDGLKKHFTNRPKGGNNDI